MCGTLTINRLVVSKMDILGFGIQMVESIKMIEEGWIVLTSVKISAQIKIFIIFCPCVCASCDYKSKN